MQSQVYHTDAEPKHGWMEHMPRVLLGEGTWDNWWTATMRPQITKSECTCVNKPVFTGSGPSSHWNPLIQDACKVGLECTMWQFFDTAALNSRASWIWEVITRTKLWKEGMQWEEVDTPQQAPEQLDCGVLTCAIAVACVQWSSNLNMGGWRTASSSSPTLMIL